MLSHDIERFRYFSQGYLYRSPDKTNVLGDLRHSIFPDSIAPLWGIVIDPELSESHAQFKYFRRISKSYLTRFWEMVRGLSAAV